MNKYKWRIESFAKGIDPTAAEVELERIEKEYGSLTPENVLEASRNKDAVLYSLFTWDNNDAAHKYRLQQARTLINNIEVITVSNGEERSIPVYEIVIIDSGRSYKHINDMSSDEIEQVKKRTVRELNSLKQKLSVYKQFDKALVKLSEATEIIEGVS